MSARDGGCVRTGLDRLAAGEPEVVGLLRGARVGLLCHAASVDRRLRHAKDLLAAGGGRLVRLFAPEHGLYGAAQDMVPVAGERDAVPVVSLYGERFEDLRPPRDSLEDLDVLAIDLQDVGARYYTYVWTALLAAEAALRAGVRVVALDRPNPLGGERLEGAPQQDGYCSFVGLRPVPVRHGMTLGELLRLEALQQSWPPEVLQVVPMLGWRRAMRWEDCGLPWVMPSPNMPTVTTARVYPGGCLLEGTRLSEGRGTTRPFEIWGAPFVEGEHLARLEEAPGARLRPLRFRPTFHKHAGQDCGGVQVHLLEAQRFEPLDAYAGWIAEVAWRWPERFAWRTEPYEFVDDVPAIDLLTGSTTYREAVEEGRRHGPARGRQALEAWRAAQREGAARFDAVRRPALLYT